MIINEFQHIVETGEITMNKVANWLKQVVKATNVPFVMAGMPTATRVSEGHGQFTDIIPYRHTLDQFNWRFQREWTAFREFLALVNATLPFDGVAGLADKAYAELLFIATRGRLRVSQGRVPGRGVGGR